MRPGLSWPLTPLIGRERELAEVGPLLGRSRLVTLTGAGGVGKTRLALAVAQAWFAGECDVLDLSEGAVPLPAGLEKRLLILDTCERAGTDAARLATAVLTRYPGVTVLATSRAPLGVPGEVTGRVPPLGRPAAAALFLERARAARPGLILGLADEVVVGEICDRVDGVPLALELAAARAAAMTLPEIGARLTGGMELLAADGAGPARQRTLRASAEWSLSRLSAVEAAVLRRLTVFDGSWSLAAAEAVGAGEPVPAERVAATLAALVDRSLVEAEQGPDGSRYRLLATIRPFAAELPLVGLPVAERADPDALPLTRRELQVARLITTGLTNRQIGARLFIAERTVDTHVGRILAKLGCATRTQVAALMATMAAAAAS